MSIDFGFSQREKIVARNHLAEALRYAITRFEDTHYDVAAADGCDWNIIFSFAADWLKEGPNRNEKNLYTGKNVRRLFWEEKNKLKMGVNENPQLQNLLEEKLVNNNYIQNYKYNKSTLEGVIKLESKESPDVERRDHPRIIELESKDVLGVERQDHPRIIGWRANNLLTSSAEIILASSAREQGRSWRRAPGSSSHHRLESKDVPGVERRDRPRIIGSRARTFLASSARIILALSSSRARTFLTSSAEIILASSSSRARTFLASSAGIVLASSAREQRISWRRATRSS
ncbi:hypothetical protein TKK_0002510 [Trichogramma kaykai]